MHPDLEKLIGLQGLDLELKRVRDAISTLPRHIAELAARSAAAQATLLAIEGSLAKEENLRRVLESDTRDQTQRAARAKRQMDAVTTTVQAAALEHEIAFALSEVHRLEDAELESMEKTEVLEGRRALGKEEMSAAETLLERERLRAASVIAQSQTRIKDLESKRDVLRQRIGEAALTQYDRVAKSRGTGLAEGLDHKCSACQMMVRPQRWNDLRDRSNDDLMMSCESCGRLLYWDPTRDAPGRKNAQEVEAGEPGQKAEVR